MAGILQSNINLNEVQKLLYVRGFGFYGCYGGWRPELLVEAPRGAVEEKFLLCNDCRGVLRDACLYTIDGIQQLRCSACIPHDTALIVAQLNREIINTRQVRIFNILITLISFSMYLFYSYLTLLDLNLTFD